MANNYVGRWRRYRRDKEYREKQLARTKRTSKDYFKKRKIKENKRCIDCGKLITWVSTRCQSCSCKKLFKK